MITQVETETPVDFVSLVGDPIQGLLVEVEDTDDDDLFVTVVVPPEAFARVLATEAFGLLDEALDDDTDPTEILDPEVPVTLRLRLRDSMRTFVLNKVHDIGPSVLNALGGFHPLSATLRQSEAWLLCTATQPQELPPELQGEDASLEGGFQTAWAR